MLSKHFLLKKFEAQYQLGLQKLRKQFSKGNINILQRIQQIFSPSKKSPSICEMIDHNIKRKEYIQAYALILAVDYYYLRQQQSIKMKQIDERATHIYNNYFDSLNNLQKIVVLEKLLKYDENSTVNNLRTLLNAYIVQEKHNQWQGSRKEIEKIYWEIYQQSPDINKISVGLEWLSYEVKKAYPSIQSIADFAQRYGLKEKDLLLALIAEKKINTAWKMLLLLKQKIASQSFSKYAVVLAMIDLHQHKGLIQFAKSSICQSEQKILIEAAKQIRQKFEQESGEDKVKNNQECIEKYEQISCYELLLHAYKQKILLLTLGHPYLETIQRRDQRILEMYEKIMELINIEEQTKTRKQKINRCFSNVVKIVLKQSQPNYALLLKILNKYSFTQRTQTLVCICMKDFKRARMMIQCDRIARNFSQSNNWLEKIVQLMENKKYACLKKYVKGLKQSNQVWETDLRKRIVENAEREERQPSAVIQ